MFFILILIYPSVRFFVLDFKAAVVKVFEPIGDWPSANLATEVAAVYGHVVYY